MIKASRRRLLELARRILHSKGLTIIKLKQDAPVTTSSLPEESKKYLFEDNPRLQKFMEEYNGMSALTNSHVWKWNKNRSELLRSFRGDKAYVWQLKGMDAPELRYLTSTYYQINNDRLNLLEKFQDDDLFGNCLFKMAGYIISREVLDSANEINFLQRNLKLSEVSQLKILDIGAGYGRLAHRFTQALDNIDQYYCTDGIPVSAFICDYYIRFRKINNAKVVSMPLLEKSLTGEKIHLAINIHSFSECSLASIDWWIRRVAQLDIPYFMIVPNAFEEMGARLLTNKREDFSYVLDKYGYKLIKKEPKYSDAMMQQVGLCPTYYYLFEKQVRP
jgi:putative sugar O-methyltransferase